jgi:hypothetical protein
MRFAGSSALQTARGHRVSTHRRARLGCIWVAGSVASKSNGLGAQPTRRDFIGLKPEIHHDFRSSGSRPAERTTSELLGLDWTDVDIERRLLKVRKPKAADSGSSRSTPRLEPLFLDYLQVRAHDQKEKNS